MSSAIVGIDLGTTNSEVAGFRDDKVQIFGRGASQMLPSCVGLSNGSELLVGQAARNQQLLHPDRTIRSIKRKMGTHEVIRLGDKTYSPPDISALILRELADWARTALGRDVDRAVITVPAYFSDAQRQATREAGALAGLEVVRLINEPTAASLAYGYGEKSNRTVMVYDLGGGTFDVSIVEIQDQVTHVLASHGNNHLGGDDFDELLVKHLVSVFRDQHQVDLAEPEHRGAYVRVCTAAEEAKKQLSFEPATTVREESLAHKGGKPRHMQIEISRDEYEDLIRPLIESTLDSVSKALADAGKQPADVDAVLLVGGSTRSPLVRDVLARHMGTAPHLDVHPDLCVALGAGLLASRIEGHDVEKVLVDVCPYSFGVSYMDERGGVPYPYCYKSIIERNTPLPVTRTERFQTVVPEQTEVQVNVFQGENPDALNNTLVGDFRVKGLTPTDDLNEVLCRMKLDLDGILEVSAIEKRTGLSKQVSIDDALNGRTKAQIESGRRRLEALFATRSDEEIETDDDVELPPGSVLEARSKVVETQEQDEEDGPGEPRRLNPQLVDAIEEGRTLVSRCRQLIDDLHDDYRVEAADLNERVEDAINACAFDALNGANEALKEFLFFVEGR